MKYAAFERHGGNEHDQRADWFDTHIRIEILFYRNLLGSMCIYQTIICLIF